MLIDGQEISRESIRHDWLLRTLLIRNLVRGVDSRRHFVESLYARAESARDNITPCRSLDLLAHAWRLADNILSVFEVMASGIDIRNEQNRLSVQHRIGGRHSAPSGRFFDPIFRYQSVLQIPPDAYRKIGLDPDSARAVMAALVTRSRGRLRRNYKTVLGYSRRYRSLAHAYEHGRSVFGLSANVIERPTFEMTLRHDETVLSTIRKGKDGVERLAEFTADAEFRSDVSALLEMAAVQVPALIEAVEQFEIGCRAILDPNAQKVRLTFRFFADPYSTEEQVVLGGLASR